MLLAFAVTAVVGATAVPRMTLAEVVLFARDHSPQVRAARASVEAQRVEAGVPRAAWYPTAAALLEAVGATTNNSTATVVSSSLIDLPRIGSTTNGTSNWSPSATTLGAIGVRQQVFDFGRIGAQSAFADANVDAERARADAVIRDTLYAAAVAYYDVLGAKAIVEASTRAMTRAIARRDFVVAGIERGLRPPIERQRAEADLQRFDVARIRSEGALTDARAQLAAVIGADAIEVDAAPAMPLEPVASLDSSAVVAEAEPNDPVLREARLRADAQKAFANATDATTRPSLVLTGALSARAGGAEPTNGAAADGNGFVPNVPNWSVGLVFQVPLFDAGVRARAAAARATEHVLRERAEGVRISIVTAAARAARAQDVARDALPALARAREAADANYEQADARFKAGLGTSIELADAEALRVDAEIQYAIGVYAVARARLDVARALSRDLVESP